MIHRHPIKLKYIVNYISRGDAPSYVEKEGIPVVNQSCIWSSGLNFSKVRYHDPKDLKRITSWINKGDILINSTGTGTLGRVSIVDTDPNIPTFADGHVTIIRDTLCRYYPKFLFYYLSIQQETVTAICSEGATNQIELSRSKLGSLTINLPPLATQHSIANYLDHETAKINTLISAKERLLNLLVEKRHALITNTLVNGLNHDVPMCDSRVEWLGKIPKHWGVEFAKWLFQEIDERSTTGGEELLTVSHLTGVTLRSEKDVNMFMAETMDGYKICHSGDLVINTLWAWMGAMGVASQNGIVSPAYHVYRPCDKIHPPYIDFIVRIPIFAQEVTRYSKGVWSSRLRLYPEEFFQVLLPVPPLKEQEEIANYLIEEVKKLDNLTVAAQKTIELLHERRTSLITDAVTGQISVTM